MATIIDMPKLSDTMTVGTVANWLKNEGDSVESGDVIAEIETDKATMELEAFDEGVLLKQIAAVGTQVPVGSPICAIGEEGESIDIQSTPATDTPASSEASEEPVNSEKGSSDTGTSEAETAPTEKKETTGRIKASPLARKIAEQQGVDLSKLTGSGPNGRIVKKDVLGAGSGSAAAQPTSTDVPASTSGGIAVAEDIPVSQMRAVIAQRLQESKTTAPHFYLESEIDVGALLDLRKQLNSELAALPPEQGGIKFTVNDFILKAATEALRRVPAMNRSWAGKTIRQHSSVDISFGVAIEDGLLTPVIRNADAKSLKTISAEAKELIGKARSKKLSPNEMSGSTFTVTNLGMFGVTGFYGIINTPNAGILSVGATIARPVVRENGSIEAAQIMKIGLSCDHRVVDGAIGAQFLQSLKTILENPAFIFI
jgi:pyruvate dehydrogenase E2 component (dihydrolipoamide acetyltransferase)